MSKKTVLLSYASNSGATFLTGELIASLLKDKHNVVFKKVSDTTTQDIRAADYFVVGSNSWNYQGKEGQPHESLIDLWEKINSLDQKPCAVFGCGDTSYTFFCGAVDVLENWITQKNGRLLCAPLKIDGYFFDLAASQKLATEWVKSLLKVF